MPKYEIDPEMAYAGAVLFSQAALGLEAVAEDQLPVLVFAESQRAADRSNSEWLELFTALGSAAREYCHAGKNRGSKRRLQSFVGSVCSELEVAGMKESVSTELQLLLDTGEHFIQEDPIGAIPEPREIGNRSSKNSAEAGRSTDCLQAYLQEISRYRLLSPEEVVERAHRYERGRIAITQLQDGEDYDETLRERLLAEVEDGDIAFHELFTSNLRYVVSIAKRFVRDGRDIMDIIDFGNKGLKRAVEKFDPSKGFKFSTYATWWIRQAIDAGILEETREIYLPRHMVESCVKVEKLLVAHSIETDPLYTLAMAWQEAGVRCPLEEFITAYQVYQGMISYDIPVSEDETTELIDLIPATDVVEDGVVRKVLNTQLQDSFTWLSSRESHVLTERYIRGRDRVAVGEDFNKSREWVRKVENSALARLRHYLSEDAGRPLAEALLEEYNIIPA